MPSSASSAQPAPRRILLIKLGAFGDFVVALAHMKAVRDAHPDAHITLLTTPAFAGMGRACGLFDAVRDDGRPKGFAGQLALARDLRRQRFDRVYDLQRNDRTKLMFHVMRLGRPGLEWNGIFKGASHFLPDPREPRRHAAVRYTDQLAAAGITAVPPQSDLSFLDGDLSGLGLPDGPLVLMVPGGAPQRPAKRAPSAVFIAAARHAAASGATPVLIGTDKEADALDAITGAVPEAVSLQGRTDFGQLAALARRARAAIGNDTGPMHLIAVAGCPSVVLFSRESDPVECRPWAARVETLQRDDLADLPVAEVTAALDRALS
ncbi:ADP-heptose--lipooligosaccharide heptosyltransferase II [Caenispirillum salinarum AK4]|uniref:ADP-heptose--lipooligosaccharide heptosyltransferase II n=1 Tax=Caenispirillum salinarum AK4 TaxID=1238182 RepID=K9H0T7_9PROT|nr:glycosyltransferase family 9 protein [Caenispirillum salinarum]EKV31895.1 ADP-heptose--lipooligosaccharide heptosyltransferase II [Caenispirillum salinarum AK4]